jgi:hypothetical protein
MWIGWTSVAISRARLMPFFIARSEATEKSVATKIRFGFINTTAHFAHIPIGSGLPSFAG